MTGKSADSMHAGIGLMPASMLFIVCNDAVGKHLTQQYSIWQLLWMRSWIWVAVVLV